MTVQCPRCTGVFQLLRVGLGVHFCGRGRGLRGQAQGIQPLPGRAEPVLAYRHDLNVARDAEAAGALNWAASQLDLPALADSGYAPPANPSSDPIRAPAWRSTVTRPACQSHPIPSFRRVSGPTSPSPSSFGGGGVFTCARLT